jgi:hypothetical protein
LGVRCAFAFNPFTSKHLWERSLIFFGERRLLRALDAFVAHYHRERNHPGLGNELIIRETRPLWGTKVRCRERLGGLLRYYHRAARAWDEFSDSTRSARRRSFPNRT